MEPSGNRDLVLAPGEFAYVLDTTKGLVNVNVGPYKTSMAGTDQPVIFDKGQLKFIRTTLEQSIQRDLVAPEGFYLALYNPAEDNRQPIAGKSSTAADLKVGHRVHLHGPVYFSLWPGQMADVIRGHHLRSNQYLLAQVYNDVEASQNWSSAVVKPQGEGDAVALPTKKTFAPGQLMVIKGTDVAFFMPPTGVKVVPEGESYVREAVTLERLEYCILLDEDGNKRFVQGPDVVFPEPTERFIEKKENGVGIRKFRAIELNETTGIYVKVIADYTDEKGVEHKAGGELFITGKEQAIYFQREEHSVIRYGDQTKHYAVAIPSGEGRYVLDRLTGNISLERGPKMLLCDPRHEVIALRVLSDKETTLFYPGNAQALQVNRQRGGETKGSVGASESAYEVGRVGTSSAYMAFNAQEEIARTASRQLAGDTFTRGKTFTPPRSITLDTKYDGAVAINVWSGYAVMVVNKTGKRRVVSGPETVLLEYDETLSPMQLSTGRPKSDAKTIDTVYLRVSNNTVSDVIDVETQDLVSVKLALSYRVNFVGADQIKWFGVDNYVQLLCDHMRSLVRNAVKRVGIEKFYGDAINIIRDTILGVSVDGKRPGRTFAENGMSVYDVEVIDVAIATPNVAALLGQVQLNALGAAIRISEEERTLEFERRSETIKRETAALKAETATMVALATNTELTAKKEVEVSRVNSEAAVEAARSAKQLESQNSLNELNAAEIARQEAIDNQRLQAQTAQVDLELKKLVKETEEIVKRTEAVDENLAVALTAFADSALMEKMVTALGPMAAMSGVSVSDILAGLLKGTPLEGVLKQLGARTRMPAIEAAKQ